MRRIFKYQIYGADNFLKVPGGPASPVLAVQMQGDMPTIWILVDPDAKKEWRGFITVSTGQEVPENGAYVGTFQSNWFVGHVFEVPVAIVEDGDE